MDREQRHKAEDEFSRRLALDTFTSAQDFTLNGFEHDGGDERFNTALAFGAAYRVTTINHATMGVVAYITEMVRGEEVTYAVPPVHLNPEGMADSELFPQMFPNTKGKTAEFLAELKTADAEKLFTLNAVMRYLVQHG